MSLFDEAEADALDTGTSEPAPDPQSAANAQAASADRQRRQAQQAEGPPPDWDQEEPAGAPVRRRARRMSGEAQQAFNAAAADIKRQLDAGESADPVDDLDLGQQERPVRRPDDDRDTVAKPAATGATRTSESSTAATPPAPSLDPHVLELRRELETRVRELDEREKILSSREQGSEAQRIYDGYAENTVPTVVELVKRSLGLEKDDDIKAEVADLVSELSAQVLGVDLPPEVKAALENKRTKRIVTNHDRRMTAREAEIERKNQEASISAQRGEAIRRLDTYFSSDEGKQKLPWLARESTAGQIVVEWIEGQMRRDGKDAKPMAWHEAAKLANDVLEKRAKKFFEARKDLFGVADDRRTNGNARQGNAQKGDPTGIRGSRSLTNAAASQPSAPARAPDEERQEPAAQEGSWKSGRFSRDRYHDGIKHRLREAFRDSEGNNNR